MENKNIKILCIDDNKDNLFTLKVLIKEQFPEIKVLTALSGKEGLKIAINEDPHLILLDIIMPEMDGFEMCRRLKATNKICDIPVVFVTALGATASKIKSLECGGEGFLSKPIDESELTAQVRAMLKIRIAALEKLNEKEQLEELIDQRTAELKLEIDERKQIEIDLKENEYLLTKAQEMGKIGTWELDIKKNTLKWTDEVYGIFGLQLGVKITGETFFDSVHPDDRDYIREKWNVVLENESYDIEYRILVENKVKWVRQKANIEFDAKGNPIWAIGFTQDITNEKIARQKIKESEEKIAIITKNASDFIMLVDTNLKIQFINKTVPDLKKKEVLGKSILDFVPKGFKKIVQNKFQTVYKTGRTTYYQTEYVTKKGEVQYFDVRLSPVIKSGKVVSIVSSSNNVTDRKKVEIALSESEELTRSITQSAADAIISINSEGSIMSWNLSAEKIFGYSAAEMIGEKLQKVIPAQYKVKHKEGLALLKNGHKEKLIGKSIEIEALRKDGTVFPIELSLSSWKSATNKKYFTGIIRDITEKKVAAERLIKSEHRLRQVIENSKDWIWEVDVKGMYIYASDIVKDILGYKPEEIVNKKHFYDLFQKQDRNKLKKIVFEVFKQKKPFNNFENRNTAKNGKTVWVSTSGIPILDDKGKLVGYRGSDSNITKRKKDELVIKESRINLLDAQKIAKLGSFKLDLKTQLAIVSPTFNVISGINSNKEISFATWRTITHPEDSPNNQKVLENCIKTGEKFDLEYRILTKDKKELKWIHGLGDTIYKDGDPVQFVGTIQDITERKIAEQELRRANKKVKKSEKKFRELFEKSGDAILIIKNGLFVDCNQATVEMLNYNTKEGFLNSHPSKLSPKKQPDGKSSMEKAEEMMALSLHNGTHRFEWMHTKSDGTIFPVEVLLTAISYEPDNKIIHVVWRDITERKEGVQELLMAKEKAEESDKLKTEFLNNMSHEIRTPMNGILGFSDMLSIPDLADEKRANFVKIIQSSSNQLLRVIDDILEISRLGTKQIKARNENVNLNDVLLELFSIFDVKAKENKTPLYLIKGLSDEQSEIKIDKTILNKVLNNLLDNALKFTNKGFIEFGYQLNRKSKPVRLEIYVKDTGVGIEQAKHEMIFERFSQAEKDLSKKVGGLGLGLSIAKENTELLGGQIRLESKKGAGATFFVTIPYDSVLKNIDIVKEDTSTQQKHTILIAEDEEVNYLYLETLLIDIMALDCKIIHVKNGEEAVEMCKENKAVDLVLMDLKMPVMNGYEATKLIKEFLPKLPIIAQTAYSTHNEKEKATLVGCDDFMSKPISQKTMEIAIGKHLLMKFKSS